MVKNPNIIISPLTIEWVHESYVHRMNPWSFVRWNRPTDSLCVRLDPLWSFVRLNGSFISSKGSMGPFWRKSMCPLSALLVHGSFVRQIPSCSSSSPAAPLQPHQCIQGLIKPPRTENQRLIANWNINMLPPSIAVHCASIFQQSHYRVQYPRKSLNTENQLKIPTRTTPSHPIKFEQYSCRTYLDIIIILFSTPE